MCSAHRTRSAAAILAAVVALSAAVARAEPLAWVSTDTAMVAIDTATATVQPGPYLGLGNAYGVAVHPAGTKIYTTTFGGVRVIDAATGAVDFSSSANESYGVAVHPAGTVFYFTHAGGVTGLNTTTFLGDLSLATAPEPRGMAINPAGTRLYVVHRQGMVSVIDTVAKTVIATVLVGNFPERVAVHPSGSPVYVTNGGHPVSLSVIDASSNTVTATVPLSDSPLDVAVSPDGNWLRVLLRTNSGFGAVYNVTFGNQWTVPVGYAPTALATTPDGAHVYVTNTGDGPSPGNTVSVIDTATHQVITRQVGPRPRAIGEFIRSRCLGDAVCNDGNPCTADTCGANHYCVHAPAVGPCDDGNACTSDACQAGECVGTPVANGTSCNDGHSCTSGDACQAGTCTGSAVSCVDASGTWYITASPIVGPQPVYLTWQVTQQNLVEITIVHGPGDLAGTVATGTIDPDTGELEAIGVAGGSAIVSFDVTVAADGQTLAGTYTYSTQTRSLTGDRTCDADVQCDDQNACTSNVCSAGTCTFPAVPDFSECPDDGDVCTRDWCVSGACAHPPAADLTPCNDGNACTASDQCHNGVCEGTCQPGQPCGSGGQCAAGGGCNPTCTCQ